MPESIKRQTENQDKYLSENAKETRDYLAELLSQAENAFMMYRQAQKEVIKGYKRQEQQIIRAYKEAEKKVNDDYQKAIRDAIKTLQIDEEKLREEYSKKLETAKETYSLDVIEANRKWKTALAEAREIMEHLRGQMWAILTRIEFDKISDESELTESLDIILAISGVSDPVLAELWDNAGDEAYDQL
ncbi:MAG TPA: hypothetical protein G4O18_05740 [Dehalococcoidia bacterium]|nr:hypothetical protein [Dehalococcoidia bacterium]